MRTLHLLPAPLLVLLLAACGGSVDGAQAGRDALDAGDHAAAIEHFDAALEGLTPADPAYRDLKVDRALAQAWTDPKSVPDAVKALAAEVTLDARTYRLITTELVNAKAFEPAVQVMDLGIKAFPEDEKMAQVKDVVIRESKAAGDAGALEALAGMGYLGGD